MNIRFTLAALAISATSMVASAYTPNRVEQMMQKSADRFQKEVKAPQVAVQEILPYEAPILRNLKAVADDDEHIFLDSIVYCYTNGQAYKVQKYTYTDDGYLASVKACNPDGSLVVPYYESTPYYTESYLLEYEFDGQHRCTRRSQYSLTATGEKLREVARVEARYTADIYYENVYEPVWMYDDATQEHYYGMYLDREKHYDQWDNIIYYKAFYSSSYTDDVAGKGRELWIQKFTGPFYKAHTDYPTYNYADNYWNIQDRRIMYLHIDEWGNVEGSKKETVTEGDLTTTISYKADTVIARTTIDDTDLSTLWKPYTQTSMLAQLNSDGTRPLRTVQQSGNQTSEKLYEWDAKGRITRFENFVKYDGSDSYTHYFNTYTYRDDYVRPATLEECIYGRTLENEYGSTWQNPIDEDQFFSGNLETYIKNDIREFVVSNDPVPVVQYDTTTTKIVYDEYKPSGNEWYHCYVYNSDGTVDEQYNISEYISMYTYHEDGKKIWYRYEEGDSIPAPSGMATMHYQTVMKSEVSKDGPWQILMEHNWGFDSMDREVYFMVRRFDEISHTWMGQKRITTYASATDYGTSVEYYWDGETGGWVQEAYNTDEDYFNRSFIDGNIRVSVNGYKSEGVIQWADSVREWIGLTFQFVDPVNNYEAPVSPFDSEPSRTDEMFTASYRETFQWDTETQQWKRGYNAGGAQWEQLGDGSILQTNYDQVSEWQEGTYVYRMVATGSFTYSFDAAGRVIRREYQPGAEYANPTYAYIYEYDYWEDTPYVKEVRYQIIDDYSTPAQPTRYYYHRGRYVAPTLIELTPSDRAAFTVSGREVRAEGVIRIYDASGALVATGNGSATLPAGFCIIEAGNKRVRMLTR